MSLYPCVPLRRCVCLHPHVSVSVCRLPPCHSVVCVCVWTGSLRRGVSPCVGTCVSRTCTDGPGGVSRETRSTAETSRGPARPTSGPSLLRGSGVVSTNVGGRKTRPPKDLGWVVVSRKLPTFEPPVLVPYGWSRFLLLYCRRMTSKGCHRCVSKSTGLGSDTYPHYRDTP